GLQDRIHDELTHIERAEARIKEMEAEVVEIQAHAVDVTEAEESDEHKDAN
ncbi:MAG: hypothetical protein IAF58_00680, partial [Leptolyngbya sp.]|nr:hypothetical protein [Candidatus Melainabacteria bacterium]